ncbi:hypothetical protein SLA2020_382670 [Shorea laevis]
MGSCISKCRPKKHSPEEFDRVQDKLVISQAPKTPSFSHKNKISPSPPSPTTSTSSTSSLTCTTSNATTASSLSRESPHSPHQFTQGKCFFRLRPPKYFMPKRQTERQNQWRRPRNSQSHQRRECGQAPLLLLARQKSFRREPERPSPAYSLPSRTLRSPSPSRRYNGDRSGPLLTSASAENHSKRVVGNSKANTVISSVPLSLRNKENFRPASPSNIISSRPRPPCLRTHRIGSKIDEVAVGKALSDHEMIDSIPMEDIDNPLISLDCFIFL